MKLQLESLNKIITLLYVYTIQTHLNKSITWWSGRDLEININNGPILLIKKDQLLGKFMQLKPKNQKLPVGIQQAAQMDCLPNEKKICFAKQNMGKVSQVVIEIKKKNNNYSTMQNHLEITVFPINNQY